MCSTLFLLRFSRFPGFGLEFSASLFEGTFASEIIRAGILSVQRGQWEASTSIGLSRWNTYRYIVLPQAVPLMLPPLTGVLINLIKHSAIVNVIAVFDF